jgi:hypothetical protein
VWDSKPVTIIITQHAIVTPVNDEVDNLRHRVDEAFPPTLTETQLAERRVYLSADSVVDEGHGASAMYPTEFFKFFGLPRSSTSQIAAPSWQPRYFVAQS